MTNLLDKKALREVFTCRATTNNHDWSQPPEIAQRPQLHIGQFRLELKAIPRNSMLLLLSAIRHSCCDIEITRRSVKRVVHEGNMRLGKLPWPVPRRRKQIRQWGRCPSYRVIQLHRVNAAVVETVKRKSAKNPRIQRIPDVNKVSVGKLKCSRQHPPQLKHAVEEQQEHRALQTVYTTTTVQQYRIAYFHFLTVITIVDVIIWVDIFTKPISNKCA